MEQVDRTKLIVTVGHDEYRGYQHYSFRNVSLLYMAAYKLNRLTCRAGLASLFLYFQTHPNAIAKAVFRSIRPKSSLSCTSVLHPPHRGLPFQGMGFRRRLRVRPPDLDRLVRFAHD